MQRNEIRIGTKVRVHLPEDTRWHNQTGSVLKINPKNVKLTLASGKLLIVDPSFLVPDDGTTPPALVGVSFEDDFVPPPVLGAVVEYTGTDVRIKGLYVVLGGSTSHGRDVVKIAKLGGDGDRYWRIPAKSLKVVDPSDIASRV